MVLDLSCASAEYAVRHSPPFSQVALEHLTVPSQLLKFYMGNNKVWNSLSMQPVPFWFIEIRVQLPLIFICNCRRGSDY